LQKAWGLKSFFGLDINARPPKKAGGGTSATLAAAKLWRNPRHPFSPESTKEKLLKQAVR